MNSMAYSTILKIFKYVNGPLLGLYFAASLTGKLTGFFQDALVGFEHISLLEKLFHGNKNLKIAAPFYPVLGFKELNSLSVFLMRVILHS